MDVEFPQDRGTQVEKSWKFQRMGEGGVQCRPLENPGGWDQTGKKHPYRGV